MSFEGRCPGTTMTLGCNVWGVENNPQAAPDKLHQWLRYLVSGGVFSELAHCRRPQKNLQATRRAIPCRSWPRSLLSVDMPSGARIWERKGHGKAELELSAGFSSTIHIGMCELRDFFFGAARCALRWSASTIARRQRPARNVRRNGRVFPTERAKVTKIRASKEDHPPY